MGDVERVLAAIDAVELFSRYNDWTSDHVPCLPIEICRFGADGEDEIVIVKRFPAAHGESQALADCLREAQASAIAEALRGNS